MDDKKSSCFLFLVSLLRYSSNHFSVSCLLLSEQHAKQPCSCEIDRHIILLKCNYLWCIRERQKDHTPQGFFFLLPVCKLRCEPLGCVARLCPWKAAPRRGGTRFSQGQHRLPAAAPATCGAAQLRDCSDSHGKALTSVGTSGKALMPRPGAAAAPHGQCPWLCVFPCESRAPASPCPFLQACGGSRLGSQSLALGQVPGSAPGSPRAPRACCGLGAAGSRGLRAGAQPWKRAEHPPLPAAAPCYSPPSLHQPWPGRGLSR